MESVLLTLLCLLFPACKSAEPYAEAQTLHPQIVVTETAPKALPSDLIVSQLPPTPPPAVANQLVRADEIPILTQPPPIQLAPAQQTTSPLMPVGYTPKRSGLSVALEYFLDHRNDDAVAALKQYPTEDQDAALVMLPLLARMEQGENWSTMNGPQKMAYLESLRSLTRRLSKSAPLALQHVTLAEMQPSRFGEVKQRASANYFPEDYVFAYAELVNLIDFAQKDGTYNIRLDITLELIGAGEKVFLQVTSPFQKIGSISSRQDYHVSAFFNLPKKLPPGSYQLFIHVLDRDTNRTARQSLPLQVLDPSQHGNGNGKRKS